MTDLTPDTTDTHPEGRRSLQQGIAGDYQLEFSGVISEAWGRVKGNKSTLWISMAIYMGVSLGLSLILGLVVGFSEGGIAEAAQNLVGLATVPILVGLQFVAVAVASGHEARPSSVLSWYGAILKLVLTYLLMIVLIFIGFLLLVLPGIYLAIAYQLALPLAVDKNLGPWEALEASRKIVSKHWFTFFGLNFVAGIAAVLSVFLLGIPLIWVAPAIMLGFGILYRTTVGIENSTLQVVAGK